MVKKSLKVFFVIHFVMDYLFAIPLMVIPRDFLYFLGWEVVDPLSARLVAAALFGIGGMSLMHVNEGIAAYKSMLNLKILWSISAILGIFVSIVQGAPIVAWGILAIFIIFSCIWIYYRVSLNIKVTKV
jgi:hypothetical protein